MASVTSTSSSSLGSFLNSTALTSVGSSAATTGNSSLAVSGLASGFDWSSVVTQLANAERGAETPWKTQQSSLSAQNAAYSTLNDALTTLQADIKALQDPTLYQSAQAQSSDSAIATGSADPGAASGNFIFKISKMATAAQINGAANVSKALNLNSTIGTAGFGTAVTTGIFTVNGAQVTIGATDTLQQVLDNINSATAAAGNAVTASYDSASDTINLSSSNEIVVGSATDTSNFLQAAKLFNTNEALNGATHSIASSLGLGRVQTTAAIANANLATAIQDDGTGNGAFTVNGVTINYNAGTDNIQNVLDRITNSAAGVSASYDSLNNRFTLTDKTTGDVGISIQDVAGKGNFAAATGLSTGTLQHGQNLLYTVNDGPQLISESNTINPVSSGISGLSVTALNTGTAKMSVGSDTSKITSAVQKFITDYNAVQTSITAQQIVTTGADGKASPGVLTGDLTSSNIASQLRSSVFSTVVGISGAISMLSNLGIQTNGQDNTLKLADPTTLSNALANNLSGVKSFFSDSTSGWATQVNSFLDKTIGDNGTIPNHQASLTTQTNNLSTQIANLEKKITSDSAHWTAEFQAMEQAQAKVSQQLSYLTQQLKST